MVVDLTGKDVPVKFGDSALNCSRYIRAAHFVIEDERRRRQVVTQGKQEAHQLVGQAKRSATKIRPIAASSVIRKMPNGCSR